MNKWVIYPIVVSICLLCSISGRNFYAEEHNKTLHIPKTKNPPIINGKIDDICWENAVVVTDFLLHTGTGFATEQTEAYLCYDNTNLYIAFKCLESQIGEIKANIKKHDGAVSKDDCVEIFLDTNCDRNSYYHFLVNSLGICAEQEIENRNTVNKNWNIPWEARARVEKDYWMVETSIPLSKLGVSIQKGSIWVRRESSLILTGASPDWEKISQQPSTDSHR